MKDFTLAAYKRYLEAIKSSYSNILRFDEFFLANPKPDSFCLIRHDVDRRPRKALQMARIEKTLAIRTTYFFRTKAHVFRPEIIRQISALDHEIGYHYESLSDTNGNLFLAIKDFEQNLARLRKLVPVRSISMHGRPLKRFDNRHMWRNPENHSLLEKKFNLLCEAYLDIDYTKVAYISDTGRNWSSSRASIRDQSKYGLKLDFKSGNHLYYYLTSNPNHRMVFLAHPERWASSFPDFCLSYGFDKMANGAKLLANWLYARNSNPISIFL